MFDPNLGEGLQEKLLSESICIANLPAIERQHWFVLKETSDQELLNDPLEEGFRDDAQLPEMHHQSDIEAFVTTL